MPATPSSKIWFILALLWIAAPAFAANAPSALSLGGQLFEADGSAVLSANVNFNVRVYDATATCVLYSETHASQNLAVSAGRFNLILGTGTARINNVSNSGALDANVFNNVGTTAVSNCGQPTIALTAGDQRQIRISYDLGSGYVAMTPDVPLVSSAYALIADSLQGKAAADFIQVADNGSSALTQANVGLTYNSTNWPKLQALLNGTSTQYLPTSPSAPVGFNGQRLTNVGNPTLAQDAATKSYADTSVAGKPVDVAAVGPMTGDGSVLRWDATNNKWVAGAASSVPTGAAGGDLGGTYPNPTIKDNAITAAKIKNSGGGVNRLLITDATTGAAVTFGVCATNEVYAWTATGWACTAVSTLAPVTKVAGRTGDVVLVASDVGGLGTAALYDYGTAANQILRLDAGARVPAVDGSLLKNVNATLLQTRAIASTAPSNGQVLGWNAAATQWEPLTASTGSSAAIVATTGLLGGTITTTGTVSVDVGNLANKIVQLNAGAQTALQAGSQTAPSYSFAGNLGTGLYASTANQLALSVNGTAGLTVGATGVGVGTFLPSGDLDVLGSRAGAVRALVQNTGAGPAVQQLNTYGGGVPTLQMNQMRAGAGATQGGDALGAWQTTGYSGAFPGGGTQLLSLAEGNFTTSSMPSALTFQTTALNSTGAFERLRITGAGTVGIGTGQPGAALDVYAVGTTASAIIVPRDSTANRPSAPVNGMIRYNTNLAQLETFSAGSWGTLATGAAGGYLPLSGGTMTGALNMGGQTLNGSTANFGTLTLDSNSTIQKAGIYMNPTGGNVGIGTTFASTLLHLQSSGSNPSIRINDSASSYVQLLANSAAARLFNSTGSSATFQIDAVPGTSSPSKVQLHRNVTSTGVVTLELMRGDGSATIDHLFTSGAGAASYLAGNGGLVGIGTVTPAAALDVAGTGTAASAIIVPRDSTANRPSAPVNGMIRYNNTLNAMEGFINGGWSTLAAGASAGTVTNVAGGVGLTGGPITSTGTLSVDVGSAANKIVQENANAQIAQLAGSAAQPAYSFVGNANTGLYGAGSGSLAISAAGTSALTVAANGNVGLGAGATAPTTSLYVLSSGTVNNSFSPASGDLFVAQNSGGVGNSARGYITSGDSAVATLFLGGAANPTAGKISYTSVSQTLTLRSNSIDALTINPLANVGIGTTSAQAGLDIATTGTIGSAIIVPRDSTANRPSAPVNGMIRYNNTLNAMEGYINGAWSALASGPSAGTVTNVAGGTGILGGPITTNGTLSVDVGTNAGQIVQENASAQIAQSLGTVALPSYSFAGNTNTGWYSPGANQVALVANGTSALNVSASGSIGINSTTPFAKLDIGGNVNSGNGGIRVNVFDGTTFSGNATMSLANSSSGANAFTSLLMRNGNARSFLVQSAPTTAQSVLSIFNDIGGTPTKAMTVAGLNVGIGTDTPQAGLDVALTGTAASALIVPRDTASNRPSAPVNGMIRYNTSVSKFEAFENNGWSNIIGSSSPTFPLLANPIGTAAAPAYSFSGNANTGMYSPGTNQLAFAVNGTAAVSVLANGNVGIGATAPSTPLYVLTSGTVNGSFSPASGDLFVAQNSGGSGNSARAYITSGDAAGATLFFGGATNPTAGKISYAAVNQTMTLRANSIDALTINPLANVGIGTTSAQAGLDIATTGTIGSAMIVPRDSTANRPSVQVNGMMRYNTTLGVMEAYANGGWQNLSPPSGGYLPLSGGTMTGAVLSSNGTVGAPALSFANDATTGFYSGGAGSLSVATAGTARLTVNNAGYVGIGTSAPTLTLDITGNMGITRNSTAVYTGAGASPGPGATIIMSNFSGIDGQSSTVVHQLRNGTPLNQYGYYGFTSVTGASNYSPAFVIGRSSSSSTYAETLRIDGAGNVGIGTIAPQAGLDVSTTGTAASAIIVPRDSTANRPSTPVNGMLRYNSATSKFEAFENAAWTNIIGGGSLSFPLLANPIGTASAPAYSFSGNANTGMYSPGANQMAFSSNGTAALAILSDGSVGIGTTFASDQLLNVAGGVYIDYKTANTGTISNSLRFGGSGAAAGIGSRQSAGGNQYGLDFYTGFTNRLAIAGNGNIGINTTLPAAGLDIALTGTVASAIIVPRDSTANRPTNAVNGMLRYNTALSAMEGFVNGAWSTFATGTAASGGASLSSLTAATATNTLANANFAQVWNWDTLTSQNGLQLGSGSMTNGSILNILNTNNSAASNGNMVNITAAGASNNSAGVNMTHSGSGAAATGVRVTMASGGTTDAGTALQLTQNGGAGLGASISLNNGTDGTTGKGLQITAAGGANYGADINMTSSGAAQTATGLRIQNSVGGLGFGAVIAMTNGAATGKALSVSSAGGADGVYSTTATGRAGYFSATNGYGLIVAQGNVGVGTLTPQAGLDVATTGTAASAIIVPRDTTANRPSAAVNGMLRYNSSISKFEAFENNAWTNVIGGAPSYPLLASPIGSASAPAYAFAGNANTGFFSPGTNQVALSTNGTAALSVLANGFVGLGTTSPSERLTVVGNSMHELGHTGNIKFRDDATNNISFLNGMYGQTNLANNAFWNGFWMYDRSYSSASLIEQNFGAINLKVAPNSGLAGSAISWLTGLSVTNFGLVGVGTTNPQAGLDVVATGTIASAIIVPRDTTANRPSAAVNGMIRYNTTANTVEAFANGAWASLGAAAGGLTGTGTTGYVPKYSGTATLASSLIFDDGTNIGIGTTTASAKLTVNGDVVSSRVLPNGGNVSFPTYAFSPANNSTGMFAPSSNTLAFSTGGNERLRLDANGSMGVGTTAPQAGLDVATTGTIASAIIVPRDTTANRPSAAVNGMIRYNTTTAKFEAFENTAWTNIIGGGAPSFPLLANPIGTASAPAYAFSGNANTGIFSPGTNKIALATNGTAALTIVANGSLGVGTGAPAQALHVTAAAAPAIQVGPSAAANDTANIMLSGVQGGTAYTSVIGAGQDGTLIYSAVNGTHSFRNGASPQVTILPGGNVGIGSVTPAAKLDVAGQIKSAVYNNGTSLAIDWNNGNSQYTAPSGGACAAMTFTNLLDGGSYTIAAQGVTSGTCSFSQSGLTFVYSPANGPVTADAVYTFLRMGSKVYVSWVTGFQ